MTPIDKSPRQMFSYFRKSTEGITVLSDIKAKQLGLCYICKKPLGNNYEVDHFIPLSLLHKDQVSLSINSNNLYLACSHCNRKKSSKIRGVFSIESEIDNSNWLYYGEDIYNTYKRLLKNAAKNKCELTSLQSFWNTYINKDYKKVLKDKYPLDIRVIDIVEEHLVYDLEQYFKSNYITMRMKIKILNIDGNKEGLIDIPVNVNQSRRIKEYFSNQGLIELNENTATSNNIVINLTEDNTMTGVNSSFFMDLLARSLKGI